MAERRTDRYGLVDTEAERLALQDDWDERSYLKDVEARMAAKRRSRVDDDNPHPSEAEKIQSPESAL